MAPLTRLRSGNFGTAGGFLQAGSIAIDAGTLADIGSFAASLVTDDGVLNVVSTGS
jgi:hypothetical protein